MHTAVHHSSEDVHWNMYESSSIPTRSIGRILFHLPTEEKVLIRNIEKNFYKLNAACTAVKFNEILLLLLLLLLSKKKTPCVFFLLGLL